jgi:hypothetical protein
VSLKWILKGGEYNFGTKKNVEVRCTLALRLVLDSSLLCTSRVLSPFFFSFPEPQYLSLLSLFVLPILFVLVYKRQDKDYSG